MVSEDRVLFQHVVGSFQRCLRNGMKMRQANEIAVATFLRLRPHSTEREARQEVSMLLGG